MARSNNPENRSLDSAAILEKYPDPFSIFDGASGHFAAPAVKIVYPIYNTPRLIAQASLFTIHSNPLDSLESYASNQESFEPDSLDIFMIKSWKIPGDAKQSLLKELDELAVNTRTLYPDLDGAARGTLEREILWHP